jgi:hypothetical protein
VSSRYPGTASPPLVPRDLTKWPGTATARIDFRSEGGGGPAPITLLGVVASNGNSMPTERIAFANNTTSRKSHYASPQGAITNIRCVEFNAYLNGTYQIGTTTSFMRVKRYLEYPEGVFHQVTWGGVANILHASFSNATSDVVISSVTGQPLIIPAGAKFWQRTVNITGSSVMAAVHQLPANSDALGMDWGISATDQGNSGSIPASATTDFFGAVCFIADITAVAARSFLLTGDSLLDGQGDATSVGVRGGSGWIARGLDAIYPYFKFARRGIQSNQLAAILAGASTMAFLARIEFTDLLQEAGLNDLGVGSRAVADILASQNTIHTQFANGSRRIYQTTITCRTASSNSYADAAGQTPRTDGTYPQLNTLNAGIRAKPAPVTAIIDAADFDMTARDSGIHGAPFPPVTDGTHFLSPKSEAMGAMLPAAIIP